MKYNKTIQAKFIDRPNRFIAHVEVDGQVETVHVKNTGRCRELLLPGVTVILSVADNPSRKTKYDLIAVYKEGIGLINMDSQAPNVVVGEYLAGCNDITFIKPEYKYGDSRIDFYFEKGEISYPNGSAAGYISELYLYGLDMNKKYSFIVLKTTSEGDLYLSVGKSDTTEL